jgi:hypothetical protein
MILNKNTSLAQGLIYIFQSRQTVVGRLFWSLVVILMLMLASYWSFEAYTRGLFDETVFGRKFTNQPYQG